MIKSIIMDEDTPDNRRAENGIIDEALVKLLREFLELKLTELKLEQIETEEKLLDIEQYGEDADDAYFDWDWSRKNC